MARTLTELNVHPMEAYAPTATSALAVPLASGLLASSHFESQSNAQSVLECTELVALILQAHLRSQTTTDWRLDVRKRLTLKLVCRFWRATLVSTPELWSNIVLVPEMPQWYIDQVFQYAKATSKQLKIRLEAHSRHADVDHFSSCIVPPLIAVADTITHLSMQYGSHKDWNAFASRLHALDAQPELNLASLRHLHITYLGNQSSDIRVPLPFPRLITDIRHLHLDGLPLTSSVVGPNLISLALLNLDLIYDDAESCHDLTMNLLDCLRQTPRLVVLLIGDLCERFIDESALHNLPCRRTAVVFWSPSSQLPNSNSFPSV
ncbi:hypothetical protein MIND_01142700 [Mycena indigotica]|uniref:F-box domain-containing protein n=1 Tax=Mycena indigotica TaxID=2126181 RepID=A0A8H6S7B8_9AGAR|nr:uncharacterized protein MIND_01142700 [Mycena indigotica]KAF7293633.1 hypothetical protein MIND_01142700 [Mycena indigotica]